MSAKLKNSKVKRVKSRGKRIHTQGTPWVAAQTANFELGVALLVLFLLLEVSADCVAIVKKGIAGQGEAGLCAQEEQTNAFAD